MFSQIADALGSLFRSTPRQSLHKAKTPCIEALEERLLLSLLGVGNEIGLPDLVFNGGGSNSYTAVAQSFDVDAVPIAVSLTPGQPWSFITDPRDVQLHILVDNSGQVIGGIDGPDLYIEGVVTAGGVDYSGVLLTGEILDFGYQDAVPSPNDHFDFRFDPTGGTLMPFFSGKDIGITMTSLNSSFTDDFTVDFSGSALGTLGVIDKLAPPPESTLSGRVYMDADDDGAFEPIDGEAGLAGVQVGLSGTDYAGNAVNLTTATGEGGTFEFVGLAPGEYALTETQPEGYLDGVNEAGTAGGAVVGDQIDGIVLASGDAASGYVFADVEPAYISGFVYEDFNDDSLIDFNEHIIENVTVTLTTVSGRDAGSTVQATTDDTGQYAFVNVRPGTHEIREIQPVGYDDGQESLGTAGGGIQNDLFSGVQLVAGQLGINYNFGERPLAGSEVTQGQTATIGFWQNKNGQKLVKSLNGGATATQLGEWLGATLPNMYGQNAGANNLIGLTNEQITGFYRYKLFRAKKTKGTGPAKLDAQVMATAFAAYVTNASLAGQAAASYGFLVTDYGVGIATFNVGSSGSAFGVEDNTELTVLDILLATDSQTVDGQLYDLEAILRSLANEVYSAINEAGNI